jgi:DNA polymerase III delta prime subunit
MIQEKIWAVKYRPTSLNDYIFYNDYQKSFFTNIAQSKSIPHLILSGQCGTGKTTLAKILISECGIDENDVLIINASEENNVETIRSKIKNHIDTYAMGDYKIVLLDEGDYLTLSAQSILRGYLEQFSEHVRFIITCNYENKIMPAIKSRCQHFEFKSCDINDITLYVANILVSEDVKFDLKTIDKFISVGYPDIRQCIMLCQQHTVDKRLMDIPDTNKSSTDYKFKILELLETDNWTELRQVVVKNVVSVNEFEELYKFLYDNLHKSKKFKNASKYDEGIITIADYLYKHSIVVDVEINFVACLISLNQI